MKRFLFLPLLLIFLHCEKDMTGITIEKPQPPDEPTDPRNYTWSVDTLAYPGSYQTDMARIWGSSPTDVYTIGHNSQNRGLMWHFDGNRWRDVKLAPSQGGNIVGSIDLAGEIYGSSANDIWVVGERLYQNPNPPPNFLDSSLIIHYDGSAWREAPTKRQRSLVSIGGEGPRLWAGGFFGSLYRYEGQAWQRDSVDYPFPPHEFLNILSIAGHPTAGVYMVVYIRLETQLYYYYLFKHENSHWTALDSTKYGIHFYTDLWMSPSGQLYAAGDALRLWNGSSWSTLWEEGTIINVYGTDDQNIFLAALTFEGGKVFHYNGVDWQELENVTSSELFFADVWTDGKETFVVGSTFYNPGSILKSVVFHGE
jgi:hypothetical protein